MPNDKAKQVLDNLNIPYVAERHLLRVKIRGVEHHLYPSGNWRRGNKIKYYTSKSIEEFINDRIHR